jgi:hypothetical protein
MSDWRQEELEVLRATVAKQMARYLEARDGATRIRVLRDMRTVRRVGARLQVERGRGLLLRGVRGDRGAAAGA